MTPLVLLWIASAAGALFFFAAGFMLARRRPREGALRDAIERGDTAEPLAIDLGDSRYTSESLAALLAALQVRCQVRGLALSDDLGLPIVGVGEDVSSLAAFAGYMGDIGRRAGDFLPLGPVRRVTVEDDSGATITACPFQAGPSRIALVALTSGPGPSPGQVSEVLRSAASMIQ
ncbi:MAG TPA: hypothetical protein VIG06_22095 [Kofleriaceae bacterium]|jgi:hypothetical protein